MEKEIIEDEEIEESLQQEEEELLDEENDLEDLDPIECIHQLGIINRDILVEASSSDNQESMNAILFDISQRFYNEKLELNIVIPKVKTNTSKYTIINFFSAIKKRVFEMFNTNYQTDLLKDFDDISYFGDYITSDALDTCITEVPIEQQLIKEEGCGEAKNMNNRIIEELKSLLQEDKELGVDIYKKYEIKRELENKIKAQEEIINKLKYIRKYEPSDIEIIDIEDEQ